MEFEVLCATIREKYHTCMHVRKHCRINVDMIFSHEVSAWKPIYLLTSHEHKWAPNSHAEEGKINRDGELQSLQSCERNA